MCRQLLRDSAVRFAGYRVPHPLINDAHIKVQTYNQRTHPVKVFLTALEDLSIETDMLEKQFTVSTYSIIFLYRNTYTPCILFLQAAVEDFEQRDGM